MGFLMRSVSVRENKIRGPSLKNKSGLSEQSELVNKRRYKYGLNQNRIRKVDLVLCESYIKI